MKKRLLSMLPSGYLPFILLVLLLCSPDNLQAQAPANDECAGAITLTPGTSCTPISGTTVNSTRSLPDLSCGIQAGSADDDVWYKFTAVATAQVVTVVGGTGFNPVVDVRSGACNGITIACADATESGATETVNLSGLTIGSTYLVRVYSRYGAGSKGTFTICVTDTPPANDDCANAVTLTSSTSCTPTTGTTVAATQSLPAVMCNTQTGIADDDVWYKFTAVSVNHTVTVAGGTGFNAVVDVRSGACNGTTIACADATENGANETAALSGLTIGNTYFVRIYSRGNGSVSQGTFTICVTYPIPANDECTNAITLTSGTTCAPTSGTTLGASQSLPAISCNSRTGTADDDVWYKFTAVATAHTVTVVGGTGFNPVVDVRSGACNGTTIACADATESGATETVAVSGLTPGSIYYIRVYSSLDINRGEFTICVTTPPTNDDCAGAVTLPSNASCTSTTGTTVAATQSLAAIPCGTQTGTADDDVWYKFTAVATTHTVTVVGNGNFDAVIDVRSGACNGTTIACADGAVFGGTETVNLSRLTIGSTYYVRVYGFFYSVASQGTFTICVTHTPPANDDCAGAVTLTPGTSCTPTAGTTIGATQSLAAITCAGQTGSADDDVWYKFTAVSVNHTITVEGAGFDATVDVRSGACNGTTIACADAAGFGGTETVNLSGLTIGNTYWMRVYSRGSSLADQGTFTICVTYPGPANDECANAVTLTSGTSCTATTGTTLGATQSLTPITCGGFTGSADDDVWFKFTAAATTHYVKVVGNGNFNAVVDVRSGACNGTNIACADATASGTETLNVAGLTIGNTYWVRVYSRGSNAADQGAFTICVLSPPTNDECTGAFALTAGTSCTPITGTTLGATQSLAAITCAGQTGSADDDVWYQFTAVATTHTVTVIGGTGFDVVIDVRSGACNGSNITCADATGQGETETVNLSSLTPGTVYYVRVYSFSNTIRGTFTICMTHTPPANDDCANAVTLTSGTSCSPTTGTTGGATQSLAAITCGSTTGSADDDVWFKFTAVATVHTVTIVGATGFNPVVDVRSGICNASTTIACADDTPTESETVSLSGLSIGNTYFVRVYSYGDTPANRGTFSICVTHPCPATLAVSDPITSGAVVKEAVQVTATNQVSGGIVTYKAAQSVTLQPGFSAITPVGSLFQATTGGCP